MCHMSRIPLTKQCNRCDEVTLSQRECPLCGGATREALIELPDATGGVGNAGPGPHHGWRCEPCGMLFDGGRQYGFACHLHGGREPEPPEGIRDVDTEYSRRRRVTH